MFIHLPVCTIITVEKVVCILDVLLEWIGNLPLGIVRLWGWCGDGFAKDVLCVFEYLLAPPLQFTVLCGRQTANEGT